MSEYASSAFENGSNRRALLAMVLALSACDDKTADQTGVPHLRERERPVHISTMKKASVDAGVKHDAGKKLTVTVPKRASVISQLLALPDDADHDPTPTTFKDASPNCPPDMVNVADEFCIDRYEASIFSDGRRVSPFYFPDHHHCSTLFNLWQTKFSEFSTQQGLTMPIPQPESWQLISPFDIEAVSKAGVLPNGHTNRRVAELACKEAGKELCSSERWIKACKGEKGTKFPYGDTYKKGLCNVFRDTHPIPILHTEGHRAMNDPRLNRVTDLMGQPLLSKTGSFPDCYSPWGQDGIRDMVGNLDEWVADPGGRFVGGFYARSTREGCDAGISAHPGSYFDYSTGLRCCRKVMVKIIQAPEEDPYEGLHED